MPADRGLGARPLADLEGVAERARQELSGRALALEGVRLELGRGIGK